MKANLAKCVAVMAVLSVTGHATTIIWGSEVFSDLLDSKGAIMGDTYIFELGAFKPGFTPNLSNKEQWAANWVCVQAKTYNNNMSVKQYEGLYDFAVENNSTLIPQGAAVYVWGFQGGVTSSEWILFRKSTPTAWTWPEPDPMNPDLTLNPNLTYWNAADAAIVLGIGHLNIVDEWGQPVLMRSIAVTGAASPPTTWQQWQAAELAGEPQLNGPDDDPDHDGVSNLMEFVFGTSPTQAGAPPVTPVEIVTVSGQQYLQITIARRIDHVATLTVEVSPDLTHWDSGPSHTTVVSNLPPALVVRDLTPLGSGATRRFMRLKAELSTP